MSFAMSMIGFVRIMIEVVRYSDSMCVRGRLIGDDRVVEHTTVEQTRPKTMSV